MSWTLSTKAKAIANAGENADATIVADSTTLDAWSDDAEGEVELVTKRTWVTDYASLPTRIQLSLSSIVSSMVAQKIIAYNTTGYLSREADTLMNLNQERIEQGMKALINYTSLISPL